MSMIVSEYVSCSKLLVPFIMDVCTEERGSVGEYELRYRVLPKVDNVLKKYGKHFDLDTMDIIEIIGLMTLNGMVRTVEKSPTEYKISEKGKKVLEKRISELETYLNRDALNEIREGIKKALKGG